MKVVNAPVVVVLQRFAVKGLSPDSLTSVSLGAGDAFPSDRAYALLDRNSGKSFDPTKPSFNHKSHFVCAFTECEALSAVETRLVFSPSCAMHCAIAM